MGKLSDQLQSPDKKRAVAADVVRLIDDEVDRKGGIGGLAIKGAYKVVKTVRAGFIDQVVDALLPEFARALDPFLDERQANAAGESHERFLAARSARVADALLSITDARAARADRGPVRGAYEKLRPSAKRNVEEAVPGIGRVIDRHL